jgi:transcriptional regulator with XRE-family HTH domain
MMAQVVALRALGRFGMLTSHQIRAGRALVGWSARVLAEQAGVHIATVQRLERQNGPVHGTIDTLRKIQAALEGAGVEFLADASGPGVRLHLDRAAQG